MDDVLHIRKYPNRRLYDRSRSRHLTAEDLHRLVAEGHRVQVTDSRTGEDITNVVLAQILLEHDPLKLAAFPPEFLHLLIRASHRTMPSLERAMMETTSALARGWADWRSWSSRLASAWGGAALPDAPSPEPGEAPAEAKGAPRRRGVARQDHHASDEERSLRDELDALRREVRALRADSKGQGERSATRKRKGGGASSAARTRSGAERAPKKRRS